MSDAPITVENLSKRYFLRHQRAKGDDLRHAIEGAVRNPFGLFRKRGQKGGSADEEFWALKDVSFEVRQGEVIGIIGRNGAGKSTLLKVLSRITEPTTGSIQLGGRVASLLEVGTGFHPELTGRENIFLNGAILGMSRVEIKRKFDEIVAFSEVEKFLDTPVKRYSSGMYVRLAFAVAAHLEPEILIVDEVLAVGDIAFQQKCLGKMDQVSRGEGRTVLFVSHNMGAIARLCKRCIFLEEGRLRAMTTTPEAISMYLNAGANTDGFRTWRADEAKWKSIPVQPRVLRVVNHEGAACSQVDITKPFSVELEYNVTTLVPMFRVALRFHTTDGILAFTTSESSSPDFSAKPRTPGTYLCQCFIPGNLLNEGQYFITVSGDIPFQQTLFHEEAAVGFFVEQTGGASSRFPEKWPGAVCPMLEWKTSACAPSDTDAEPALRAVAQLS